MLNIHRVGSRTRLKESKNRPDGAQIRHVPAPRAVWAILAHMRIIWRFKQDNGITGVLTASQVCAGEENMLRIRVYGEKGGLDWCQEDPNTLIVKYADGRQERRRAGLNLSGDAARISRTPSGHPEGYLEAFATLYSDFAKTLRGEGDYFVPAIDEALRGMTFIERVVESSAQGGVWLDMKY